MKHWALRAARGTALALVAEIAARAANTIFFVLLTWSLGEVEASTYALGFAFAGFLIQFSLGGLDQLLNREVARDGRQSALVLGNFLLARLIAALLCYGALALWLVGPFGYTSAVSRVIFVLGATLIPDGLTALCQGYLIARDRVGYITILGALTGGLKLALGALALALGGDALAVAGVVLATSLITLALYLYLICTRFELPRFSFERAFWIVQARAEFPLLCIAILSMVESSLDALLLTRGGNIVQVGVYAAASALLTPLLIFPTTFRQIILPIMAGAYAAAVQRAYGIYIQSIRFLLISALLICASLALVADQVLLILYRDHFVSAVPVMQILIWSFVLTTIAVPNGRLMLVAGRQAAAVPIQICSTLLNIGLNLVLQPRIGAQGAAIARVASAGLTLVLGLLYVQRNLFRWNTLAALAGPIGAVIALAITTASLRWLGVYWAVALAGGWLTYGAALFAFRGVSVAEIRGLLAAVRQSRAQIVVK